MKIFNINSSLLNVSIVKKNLWLINKVVAKLLFGNKNGENAKNKNLNKTLTIIKNSITNGFDKEK